MEMTGAARCRAEAADRGRERGSQEGELRALRSILRDYLIYRHGELTPDDEARVEAAGIDELRAWVEKEGRSYVPGSLTVSAITASLQDRDVRDGLAWGLEQGRREGEVLAYRAMLARILNLRLGPLPHKVLEWIGQETDLARFRDAMCQALLVRSFGQIRW